MDYARFQNIVSDTAMRESIAEGGKELPPGHGSEPD
jgi:uncharacterized protein YqfA (UPF0365 family)